jgi:NADH-ubiquinone oxidoreductase chain 5
MYYFYFGYVFIFFHFLFFLSFLLTYGFLGFVIEFVIFSFSGVDFSFSFLFDWVSFGFSRVVCLVTSSVFFYNYLYMGDYYDSKRFSYLIFLFVGSICILIFSCSMLVTMIGWDGLGLVSFLLVIYYGRRYSVDSGLLTVYSNRVGDCMFLFSFS